MECGKTRVMIATLYELIKKQRFTPSRIFANCWLDIPGSHWLRNDELKKVLRRAFNTEIGEGRWNMAIFLIMEADDLYSHITQSDKQCFEDIKTASQAYKRNQYLLYEVHEGFGVPKYLRDKTEISCRPYPNEPENLAECIICDGHFGVKYSQKVTNLSAINGRYHRFSELY